jgi:hypothetical protein
MYTFVPKHDGERTGFICSRNVGCAAKKADDVFLPQLTILSSFPSTTAQIDATCPRHKSVSARRHAFSSLKPTDRIIRRSNDMECSSMFIDCLPKVS